MLDKMENKERTYKVKNKMTGFVFDMTKDICDDLIVNEPYNFEVLDEDYVKPVTETPKTTTYSLVVEGEEEKEEVINPLSKWKVDDLKQYAKDNQIDITGLTRKDEIVERISIVEIERDEEKNAKAPESPVVE